MTILNEETGERMTEKRAQELIRRTIERQGRLIMSSRTRVNIGEVETFAGLPMRVVRYVGMEEAIKDREQTTDLWGGMRWNGSEFFFEVEIAD